MNNYEIISYGHTVDDADRAFHIETWTFRVPDEVYNAWWASRPRTVEDLMDDGNSVGRAVSIVAQNAERRERLTADMVRALDIPGAPESIHHVKQIIAEVFCICRISKHKED